jgi:hypothetical protein
MGKVGTILIGILIFFVPSYVHAEKSWTLYGVTKHFILFYDSNSISHSSKDIVNLWIKSVSKCNDSAGWAIKDHPNCANVEWLYVLTLIEIDCSNMQDRDIKSLGYSKEGGESLSDETSPWSDIIPESYTEILYRILCH